MRVSFLASELDPAGTLMASILEELDPSLPGIELSLTLVDREVLYLESPKEAGLSEVDLVVVLSRHSGTPGYPIITTHAPGNFSEAKFGGRPGVLGVSAPLFMKAFLIEAAARARGTGYEVHQEPTHHGPTLDVPLAFVEVGCSPREWGDREAARIVVESSLAALSALPVMDAIPAAAFGGPHINRHFTEVQLRTRYAIGHVLRKHDSDGAPADSVRQAFSRVSGGPARVAIVDWKGLRGAVRARLVEMFEEMGVEVLRVRRVLRGEGPQAEV